jgi:hypothetical protein
MTDPAVEHLRRLAGNYADDIAHEDVDLVEDVLCPPPGMTPQDYYSTLDEDEQEVVDRLLDRIDPSIRVDEPETDGEGSYEGGDIW